MAIHRDSTSGCGRCRVLAATRAVIVARFAGNATLASVATLIRFAGVATLIRFVSVATFVSFETFAAQPALAAESPDPDNKAVRSVVRLPSIPVDGIRVAEISGVAWDADDQLLYAVSDRGNLYQARLRFEAGSLVGVEPIAAQRIRWSDANAQQSDGFDAEGLAMLHGDNGVAGDAELLVATEGQPRVLRVATDGRVLSTMPLPEALADPQRYRADNAMLEAVAQSAQQGLLLAAEAPLQGDPKGRHRIHAADRHWTFPMLDAARSRLKAMELVPDGSLVVLERARAGKGKGLVNALRRIRPADCGGETVCAVDELLQIDRTEGAENFEGMAYLGGDRFLIVSDNLGSKRTPTIFMLVDLARPDRE